MTFIARDNIEALTPYVPGEQPAAVDVVKLNTNENPYPPADAVLEAISQTPAELLRRYPPPLSKPFRETAAGVHGLDPSQVIATNGGDELLRMIITAYANPGQTPGGVALTDPTYSLYEVLAQIQNAAVMRFDRGPAFELPKQLAQRANDAQAAVLFVVNPHAPSGRLEPVQTLRKLAQAFDGLLVIDEAYVNFASAEAVELIRGDDALTNVILLRSLSKGYSLAGLRFGYGLASPGVIQTLDKVRDSYNVDILAQRAAVAALKSRNEAAKSWQTVIASRAKLTQALTDMGMEVLPSETNFLLVRPTEAFGVEGLNDSPAAARIYQTLAEQHIFVRYFNHPRLRDRLRISIGTSEQNDRLLTALRQMRN